MPPKEVLHMVAEDLWSLLVEAGGKPGEITDQTVHRLSPAVAQLALEREEKGLNPYADFYLPLFVHQEYDSQISRIGFAQWADCGFPQVEMGHKLAAALLCTDVTQDALDHVHMPWRGFMIEVPDGLLSLVDDQLLERAPIRRILVTRVAGVHGPWTYIAWTDGRLTIWRFGCEPAQLLPACDDERIPNHSTELVTSEDAKVSALVGRFIINTCLAMSMPDYAKEKGPGHDIWRRASGNAKKMRGNARRFVLDRPVVIDLRERVRQFIRGEREGKSLDVRVLVRGHFKRQHYGKGNELVKVIWREPYWRGPEEAGVLVRPHVLKGDP